MKNDKTKKQNNIMSRITGIYLFLMIAIFPLFYDNNYINMIKAKKGFFNWVSIPFLVICLLWLIYDKFFLKDEKKYKFNNTEICAIVFMIITAISSWFALDREAAVWGTQGREVGGIYLILGVCVYFAVSIWYRSSVWLMWSFLISVVSMTLLIICQFWGWDILGMYSNLIPEQYITFMGTLGNININAEYIGTVTAIMMALYYVSEEELSKRCYFFAIILGIYVCFATRSDSWIIMIGAAMIVLLLFALENKDKLERFWHIALAFWISSLLVKITEVIEHLTVWDSLWIQNFREENLQSLFVSWQMLLAEILCLVILILVIRSNKTFILEKYGRKIILILLAAGVVGVIIYLFGIDDSFGNNRGYIWKRTILQIIDGNWFRKLFGYGPECFLMALEENFGVEMRAKFSEVYVDAHNVILQFVMTTGILGAAAYVGMYISLIVRCIKENVNKYVAVIGCVGLLVHLAQGMVNNPQVFTTPLIFIFMGIINNKLKAEKN